MKRGALLAVALASCPLAGCGYTEMHEVILRAPPVGPEARGPVEIYMLEQAPPRPWYEIALLQVIGHGSHANLEDVIHALTSRAAGLGCDAVVRIHVDQGYSMTHAFGACVRWSGASPVLERRPDGPGGAAAAPSAPVPPAPPVRVPRPSEL